ncbi:membrane fusion protein, multidrug efflux system [Marinobacter daqiaonensis]|uniref:Membrane fusion protein, multidrug efflux system n=1 Tax=Marinobacter daqiaonensis TaxID=650891 RepID=A0A1I6JD55_9GAMM|nr:HlyD family secretion protein [Marinobacter daqiaonensis]SFR76943.1 membrane fusion protein, multidrug efflux system [Marinobacter daqiaonensis]
MSLLASASASRSLGRSLSLLIMILLVLAAVIWGGRWLHYRLTHVHVIDARIKADMISVAARVPGRIEAITSEEGARPVPGQVLLSLDASRKEQDLGVLQAAEQKLQKDVVRKEAELAMARALDESRETIARRALATAEADVEQRRLALEKARSDLQRLQGMARDNMVSAQQLADVQYRVDNALNGLRRTRAELATAEAAIVEARARSLNQQVLEAELESMQAELTGIRASQRRIELDIEDHEVSSPVHGVVAKIFVETGEVVQAGQNLMLVYRPDRVWVEANIKETSLGRVAAGQPVEIRVDAYPGETFEGRVERVGVAATSEFSLLPSPNPSGNFTKTTQRVPVRILFDAPDGRLHPGLMVEAGIDVR